MVAALKESVIPALRSKGFSGSFPHFRRIRTTQIDLLSFQFSMWGGQFAVNLHACGPDGYTDYSGTHISPKKVKADDIGGTIHFRLGAKPPEQTDHWFRFDPPEEGIYARVAAEVLPLVESQAEEYWLKREQKN